MELYNCLVDPAHVDTPMLSADEYIQTFLSKQPDVVEATERVALTIRPRMTEYEIACRLQRELDDLSLRDSWYPILVCAGANSGQPISRRYHLPSTETRVRINDIVVVDSTPIQGTVWWNWTKTVAIGNDPFFHELCDQCDEIAEKTLDYGLSEAKTIGDLFDFCMKLIYKTRLVSLDSRNDVGHSIFQVPAGQKVEDTPVTDRLFISDEYRDVAISGILSIEPQVGRKHPKDGIVYGAKQQRILVKAAR